MKKEIKLFGISIFSYEVTEEKTVVTPSKILTPSKKKTTATTDSHGNKVLFVTGNRKNKSWLKEEDNFLVVNRDKGVAYAARKLGRTKLSIYKRRSFLGAVR